MKGTIFYVYDPLCSWCYGFSPVMKKFKQEYENEYSFEVVSGGMQSGERKQPISDIKDYLKGAYKNVTERTGVVFGENFMEVLEKGERMLDSVPASVALSIIKDLKPEQSFNFAAELHKAIYYDGVDWNKMDSFVPYAERVGVSKEEFLRNASDDKYLQKAKADFKLAADFGVTGFPSVILKHNENYYLLAQGFMPYTDLNKTLEHVLEKY
jgi:putative protein-disulfide isomerase